MTPEDYFKRLDETHPPNLAAVARRLRALALGSGPQTGETVKYGGVLFSGREAFCGVFAYSAHVTLEFGEGARLPDPAGTLLGKGKGRRHLKFTGEDDAALAVAASHIAAARALADG